MVASELLNQLSQLLPVDDEDIDNLKKFLGTFLKGSAILAGSLVGKHLLDDAAGGREFVKTLFESSPQDLLDTMKKGYSEQVNAVKDVRLQLEQLAEAFECVHKRNLPVIVLVDELDRCRPNYAIESGLGDQALKFSAYYALNMKHCVAYGDGINTNSTYQIGPSNYFYRNPISSLIGNKLISYL